METTMTKAMAVSAVQALCVRPRRSADTAHAGTFRSVQGRTVSFAAAAGNDGRDLRVADLRGTGVDVTAPVTGVGYPRLEAPPV